MVKDRGKVSQQLESSLIIPSLGILGLRLPIALACDAASHGIGVVMSHFLPNGEERLKGPYASRAPSMRKRR